MPSIRPPLEQGGISGRHLLDALRRPQLDIAFKNEQELLVGAVEVIGEALLSRWKDKHAGPQHLTTKATCQSDSLPLVAGLGLGFVEVGPEYVFHCRSIRGGGVVWLGDEYGQGQAGGDDGPTGD